MPSEVTAPGTANSIHRLNLSTAVVRGADSSFGLTGASCMCAEYEATPSTGYVTACNCFAAE